MSQSNPIEKFVAWLTEAEGAGLPQPESVTLATCRDGKPSARVVLYRGLSTGTGGRTGLRFFTNYESRKGQELDANPFAALCFFWQPLGRQVRIEGHIERVSPAESDVYFAARPRGHQLGAWASRQSRAQPHSQVVARYHDLERAFEGKPVPRPPHWGGYRLLPDTVEFWTSQDSRLHVRELFTHTAQGWQRDELGP